jgi:hypothetical protein
MRMITMKPSAFVSSATVPGTNNLRNAGDQRLLPRIRHLHGMRDADRENQKRDKDRHWIDTEAEDRQRAEQPHHRQQRDEQREHRGLRRTRVREQQRSGNQKRKREKTDHAADPRLHVPDQFRKADDVDLDILVRIARADLLKLPRHRAVIQVLAGDRVRLA